MKKFVCESLDSFLQLNEDMKLANDIFAKMGISTNDPEYQDLFNFLKDNPNITENPGYAEKFAKWVKDEGTSLKRIESLYQIQVDKKIEIDVNSFETFNQYQTRISNPELNTQNKNTKEEQKNIQDIQKTLPEEQNLIKIVTKVLSKGYECLANISNIDAMNIDGQGLYIWAFKDDLEKKSPPLKFGQYGSNGRGKTPLKTIQGYHAGQFKTVVILYAVKFDDFLINKFKKSLFAEIEVQEKIEQNQGYRLRGFKEDEAGVVSREVFKGIELNKLISLINEVLYSTSKPKLKNYSMRPEQKEAHDKMVKNFKSGDKEFLLAAKMRFGKNFALLNVAKTLNFKNVLVITYKPHVFNSLENDIKNHVNFDGWEIKQFKEDRTLSPSKDTTTIFLSSAQLAQYKKSQEEDDKDIDVENLSIEELYKNLEPLKKIPWDMIIVDEYHYGTKTDLFKKTIEALKNKDTYIVYVSGTAMKDIAMGRFEEDQIYEWSYLDEQKEKIRERDGKSPSKEHLSMPTMDMRIITLSPDIEEIEKHYNIEEGEGITMTKIIATTPSGKLKYRGKLQRLLEQIIGKNIHSNMSPYQMEEVDSNLDHTLWVLPKWSKGIMAMAELMRSMPEYDKYDIIEATGNKVTKIEEVQERINRTKDPDYKKKGTITLTCYRFKEGVSIPEWNGVLMLDDGSSVEEYLQAIFRCQNPNESTKKDKCYVFDFNPIRALAMVYQICENSKKGKDADTQEVFREFQEYANVFYNKDNKFEKANFDEVMEAFKSFTSWRERFSNIKNLELSKLSEIDLSVLEGIKPGKRGLFYEPNDNDITKGKNFLKKKRDKGGSKSEKDNTKEILEKVISVLGNIPEFLFNTDKNEKNVDDIIKTSEKELFKKITGVSTDIFSKWVEKEFVNVGLMNRNISAFLLSEKSLMSEFSGEKLEDFSKKNFQMKAEEGKTPLKLVKEMLDKLPDNIWVDPNKKFLDPCMGMGTFLVEIKERLMKQLKKIPEKEREKHILENMIYGIDKDQSKYNMAVRLLKTNKNNDHIKNDDSLELFQDKWKNMKFDVVVGNPPYQPDVKSSDSGSGSRNILWDKFIILGWDVLNSNGVLGFITPDKWRDSNINKSTADLKKAKEIIWGSNILDITPADSFFKDTAKILNVDYWIISKNKEIEGLKIPEIYKKLNYLPLSFKKFPEIQDYLKDAFFSDADSFKISLGPHNYRSFKSLKGKSPDSVSIYPHVNTLDQFVKGILEWFDKKTPFMDKKKVIISNSGGIRGKNPLCIFDDGKYGTGSHSYAYIVDSEEEGKKLENFINNSEIIKEILSKGQKQKGFGIPIHLIKQVPKIWVENFNK